MTSLPQGACCRPAVHWQYDLESQHGGPCCQPNDHMLADQSSSRPEVLMVDSPSVADARRLPAKASNVCDQSVHRHFHRPALQLPRRLPYLWLKGSVRWEHVKPVWQAQLFRGEGGGTLQGVACGKPPHGCVVPRVGEAHRGCRPVDLQQVRTVGRCCGKVVLALHVKKVALLLPACAQQLISAEHCGHQGLVQEVPCHAPISHLQCLKTDKDTTM